MLEIIKKRESWALSLSFISRRGGITRAAGGRVENFAKTCSRAISPRYPAFPPPAKFTKARGPFRPPLRFRDIIFVAVRELASPLPPTILSDKVVEITGYDGQKTTRGDIPQRFCLFFSPPLFLFPFIQAHNHLLAKTCQISSFKNRFNYTANRPLHN